MKFERCMIRHNGDRNRVKYVVKAPLEGGAWSLVSPATDACLLPAEFGQKFMASPAADPRYELIPVTVEVDLRKKKPLAEEVSQPEPPKIMSWGKTQDQPEWKKAEKLAAKGQAEAGVILLIKAGKKIDAMRFARMHFDKSLSECVAYVKSKARELKGAASV